MTPSDATLVASPSQTVGPFFHFALTSDPTLCRMVGPHTRGERVRLRVRVLDGAGEPIPDAMVELWQADADGRFTGQPDAPAGLPGQTFRGWGREQTNERGECDFDTIRPGAATAADGGILAPHINVCLFSRGMLRHLFTRTYFADDPLLASDRVLALVPASRRDTLLARWFDNGWEFEIRLQGDRETVFFDL